MQKSTKYFSITFSFALALTALVLPALAKVYSGTITGTVSDSMCQFDHSQMIKGGHGTDAASCTLKCLNEGNKLVLCDPKTKTVYNLTDSSKLKKYAGKTVSVTGHIDTDTKAIHVHSVKPQ